MFATQFNRLAGSVLVLLALAIIGNAVLQSIALEGEPFVDPNEVKGALMDINDNRGVYLTGLGVDIAGNVLSIASAVVAYLIFRGRDRVLVLLVFAALVTASLAFMMVDVANLTLDRLAVDLAETSPVGAEERDILALARTTAYMSGYVFLVAATLVGVGVFTLGALIAFSPRPPSEPTASAVPAALGWLAMASGILLVLSWLGGIDEGLAAVGSVGLVGIVLFLLTFGGWLFVRPTEGAISGR